MSEPVDNLPRKVMTDPVNLLAFGLGSGLAPVAPGTFGSIPLEEYELGWEDTFTINAGETVRLLTKFEQFTGTFVWHCHILEHEDHEMMRPFRVLPVPEPSLAVWWWLAFVGRRQSFIGFARPNISRRALAPGFVAGCSF